MRESPNLTSPAAGSSLYIRLLGPLQATLDGQPVTGFISDKVRGLLAYLVAEADQPHRREALAGLLWPEWPERTARTNLRRALANLRQVIGDYEATPPFLLTTRQTIQFNSGSAAWIDVTAFTALLEGPGAAIRQLEEAVGLYRGDFLEGFSVADSAAFEAWALLKREQLARQIVAALHRLAGYYEGRDAYEQALPYAWRQVELEPWDEPAHRQLMRLLTLNNQRHAALAQYEILRDQLAEELSVEPEDETTRLYEQIRDGEIRADVRDLREWGRLREWVEASRDDVRAHQRLTAAAAEWIAADRDPGFLLRGTRLNQFESWADTTDLAPGQVEQDYLETSLAERRAREEAEAARQARETALEGRSRNFLRALVGILTIATVIALGLMRFAFNQRGEALEAYSLSLAANAQHALSAKDTGSALVLALAANRIDRPPTESQHTLMNAAFAPGPRRRFVVGDVLEGVEGSATAADISPDGRTALAGYCSLILSPDLGNVCDPDSHGVFILWDLETGAEIRRFTGHTAGVNDLVFGPDGKRFLSGSGSLDPAAPAGDTSIRLWNLETGQEIRRFEGHTGVVTQVAISPDGHRALSASADLSVRLWDLETGEEIRRFTGHTDMVTGIAFSPDGRTGLSCSVDGTLILWDLRTGEAIHRLTGHTMGVWSVAISPDGRTALSGADDSVLILWDLETGEEFRRFLGHDRAEDATVSGIAYLPDGRTAISGGTDGYLIHWDLETGQELHRFGGHSGIRTRVSVSPDGRIAFSGGWDGTLVLWDLETGELIRRFKDPHTGVVFDSAMSPDGRTGLAGSSAQTIIQWQLAAPSLDELLDWVAANRYVRELTCDERELYRIEPLCEK
jgi:WD40 repeat protein/DNA-binding SARP family transcriptional activator